jgi:hypothetical protein
LSPAVAKSWPATIDADAIEGQQGRGQGGEQAVEVVIETGDLTVQDGDARPAMLASAALVAANGSTRRPGRGARLAGAAG